MIARHEEDFGFSFYTEEEMKANEKVLTQQLEQTKAKIATTAQDAKEQANRADQMKSAIMPFLNNLMQNPERQWMLWPDRAKRVQAFIDKLNQI